MSHPARVAAPTARARTRREDSFGVAICPTARPRGYLASHRVSLVSPPCVNRRERIHRSVSIHRARALDVPDDIVREQEPRGICGPFGGGGREKGSDILVEALEREGVDCVFAYPGGASMEIHQI